MNEKNNYYREPINPLNSLNKEEKNTIHQINQEGLDLTVDNLKRNRAVGEIR